MSLISCYHAILYSISIWSLLLYNWAWSVYTHIYIAMMCISVLLHGVGDMIRTAVGRTAKESYQCDAVGAMGNLGESHFKKMHTYRLEWEPGPDGYLRWYIDGKFMYGIEQSGLDEYGTQIPQEPSYIIFNTAISTSWGFPATPPGCTEFDCKTSSGQCGFAPGFCRTLPARFKIDSVRLYQNRNNSQHSLGCNPQAFPTRKYILANQDLYKRRFLDKHPLKHVKRGGGSCGSTSTSKSCGEEGKCNRRGKCECNHGWTGPHCLVSES